MMQFVTVKGTVLWTVWKCQGKSWK